MRRFIIKGWRLGGGRRCGRVRVGGNGFRDVGFTIGTSAEFAMHHVRGRAIDRRGDHSDGHLAFVVVITFRYIVIIIDIHAIISYDRF